MFLSAAFALHIWPAYSRLSFLKLIMFISILVFRQPFNYFFVLKYFFHDVSVKNRTMTTKKLRHTTCIYSKLWNVFVLSECIPYNRSLLYMYTVCINCISIGAQMYYKYAIIELRILYIKNHFKHVMNNWNSEIEKDIT